MNETLRILYYVAGAAASVALLRVVAYNVRRLNRRVIEFRKDLDENSGPSPNPYMALAELYAEDEKKNQEVRLRKRKA